MIHIPVLLQHVTEGLAPTEGMVFLDGTFGAGGHSKAMCKKTSGKMTLVAIDTDADSLTRSLEDFQKTCDATVIAGPVNYRLFDQVLNDNGIKSVDRALLDLGFSSDQIESGGRGISFMKDEPLLMTLKSSHTQSDLTAEEIVNNWELQNLTDIIRYYGEERHAYRIAQAIVEAREQKPIKRTFELVEIIENAVGNSYRKQKIHPATRTFQALRIAVNDELGVLKEFLEKIPQYLAPHGRVAIISFHSLEDRIVKQAFQTWEKEGKGKRITKKPIIADEVEIKENPRARSAKLRIFENI